jgi:plasmid stabilization system protein ParE
MALRFRVLAEADQEVDHAAGHYELETPGTGRRFVRAYAELVAHITEFPRTGRRLLAFEELDCEVRAFVLSSVFPYTVFAAVLDNEVVIVAVAHQHQERGLACTTVRFTASGSSREPQPTSATNISAATARIPGYTPVRSSNIQVRCQ